MKLIESYQWLLLPDVAAEYSRREHAMMMRRIGYAAGWLAVALIVGLAGYAGAVALAGA